MRPLFLLPFLLFLSACSIKNYEHSESKFITFKTAKLRFSDFGYLHHNKNALKLDMFVAGSLAQSISINHLVCLNAGCMSKSNFNKFFLNAAYPDDLLQNIILSYPIYKEKNRVKNSEGFEQKIQNKDVNIMYKVTRNSISFKDKKNHILFKMRSVE